MMSLFRFDAGPPANHTLLHISDEDLSMQLTFDSSQSKILCQMSAASSTSAAVVPEAQNGHFILAECHLEPQGTTMDSAAAVLHVSVNSERHPSDATVDFSSSTLSPDAAISVGSNVSAAVDIAGVVVSDWWLTPFHQKLIRAHMMENFTRIYPDAYPCPGDGALPEAYDALRFVYTMLVIIHTCTQVNNSFFPTISVG